MIKLVINATSLLSPLTGIGRYTYHLCKYFEKSNEVDVSFFYGKGWSKLVRENPVQNIGKIKAVIKKVIPLSYNLSRIIQGIRFQRMLKVCQPDIYHDPNYLLYDFSGKKIITVHDVSFIRYPEAHPRERILVMEQFFPKALEQADAIITDSVFSANELMACFSVDASKVFPIYLGVEEVFHQRSAVETSNVLSRYKLNYQKYVLVVGTLEPRKNLGQVIKAFQRLPDNLKADYPLVIIGMKGWGTDEIEQEMAPLVKSGQLKLLGYIPDDDLPSLYAAAKVFVYPSLYEGFGLPPLEAMASGVPVITSNQASLPEVVGDAGIQVSPDDVDELKRQLILVLESKLKCDAMIELGLKQAKKFTWEKCALETLEIYKNVLGKSA